METFNQLIQSDQPVLVDFYADWCGPCKAMEPVIKEIAQSVKDKVRIVKVSVDKQVKTAQEYQVSGIPTFMIFQRGKVLWRHSGMIDKRNLLDILAHHS